MSEAIAIPVAIEAAALAIRAANDMLTALEARRAEMSAQQHAAVVKMFAQGLADFHAIHNRIQGLPVPRIVSEPGAAITVKEYPLAQTAEGES